MHSPSLKTGNCNYSCRSSANPQNLNQCFLKGIYGKMSFILRDKFEYTNTIDRK